MCHRNRKNRCLWPSIFAITIATCMSVVYVFLTFTGKQEVNSEVSKDNFIRAEKLTDEECIPVCNTKECVLHANELLRNINPNFDPCDDFRSFLCGGFRQKFGPEERSSFFFSEGKRAMFKKLKEILHDIQAESGTANEKMKIMYDSCMDYGSSSESSALSAVRWFFHKLGIADWPNLPSDFKFTASNIPTIVGYLKAYEELQFIHFKTHKQKEEESQTDGKFLHITSYNFNGSVDISKEGAARILKYFDLQSEDIDIILDDYDEVRNSIFSLYEKNVDCEENCTDVNVICTNQLEDDWKYLCEAVEVFFNVVEVNDEFNKSHIVVQRQKDHFLKHFIPLLNSLPDRSVANFLAMNFFWSHLDELGLYFQLIKMKYFPIELHEKVEIERWERCVKWITKNMLLALQNEFFRHYLTRQVTDEVVGFYKEYKSDIADMIARQDWIPSSEKTTMENFIRNMSVNIHHLSEHLPNEEHANEYFEKFNPTSVNFFQNLLEIKRALKKNHLLYDYSKVHSSVYQADFLVNAITGDESVDIYYGIFFPPIYSPGLKKLLNIVMLATVVGHEIGHHFHSLMSNNLRDHNDTFQIFKQKNECLNDQFSEFKFEVLNENANGSRYNDENFADNIGYMLVDKIIENLDASQEFALPGFPFSTKQLLYMSASLSWCSESNMESEIYFKTKEFHAPEEFRLIGTVRNSRGYSEAFHCPDGSYMNPSSKCYFLDSV